MKAESGAPATENSRVKSSPDELLENSRAGNVGERDETVGESDWQERIVVHRTPKSRDHIEYLGAVDEAR